MWGAATSQTPGLSANDFGSPTELKLQIEVYYVVERVVTDLLNL